MRNKTVKIVLNVFACLVFAAVLAGCSAHVDEMDEPRSLDSIYKDVFSQQKNQTDKPIPGQGNTAPAAAHAAPGSLNHENNADQYCAQGRHEMAIVEYDKALIVDPDNNSARFKRAMLFKSRNLHDDAMNGFMEIIKRDKTHPRANQEVGKIYFSKKKYDEAEKYLKASIEGDEFLWKSYNLLGILYTYKGEHQKSAENYLKALTIEKRNPMLLNNLGLAYAMAGEYEKAARTFRHGLERDSEYSSKIHNNLGVVLARMGKYDEALEEFRLGGEEAQAINNLGCAYMMKGDMQKASAYFEKAIENSPRFYTTADENLKKARAMNPN